jgi:hypothetical protein
MTEDTGDKSDQITLISEELQALHKRGGIQAHDLDRRLGPHLLELTGPDPATRRQVLTAQLNSCALQLRQKEMILAVTASLGLRGLPAEQPLFRDRVAWLAERIDRDYRTALRRIKAGERLLAEVIAGELQQRRSRVAATPSGWYLREMRALLRLDTPTPESIEHRQIVSTKPGLTEVKAWMDLPRSPGQLPPDPAVEVQYGGRLTRREHPNGSRYQFFIQLPRPLAETEEHGFGLITRVQAGAVMRSHYLVVPECRCDALQMTVRFPLDGRPGWVRRVDGETVRTFDDPQPTPDLVEPDQAGEVHIRFSHLTMHLGYGIQWEP